MGKVTTFAKSVLGIADDPTAAAIGRLEAGRVALRSAEQALDAARKAYDMALGEGRDAALVARRSRDEAEVDVDVARAALSGLEAGVTAAREQARAEQTARLRRAAEEKASTFEAVAEEKLRLITVSAREIALAWADAADAIGAANAVLPVGEKLPSVEAFRQAGGFPNEVVEQEIVWRHVYPGTQKLIEGDALNRIRESGGRTLLHPIPGGGGGHPEELGPKVPYERTVTRSGDHGLRADALLKMLSVPGLTAADPVGWSAPETLTPDSVRRRLVELAHARPRDTGDKRRRQERFRRVPPGEVGRVQADD